MASPARPRWAKAFAFKRKVLSMADVAENTAIGLAAAGHLPLKEPGRGFDLLAGVRVLDLTSSVAGPSATWLLGDMGAEVVKVERPANGDDVRSWGPPFLDGESLWFTSVNRNKKSVLLDYADPAGLALLYALAAEADIVVANMPVRAAKKLKIDAATLRARDPALIYVSITGFGLEGDRADWTCYDLIAEGYSGIMDLTGPAGAPAQKVGAPAADMLAGQDAAFAAVSALYARTRTGQGCVLDVALVDSMTRFSTCRIVPYLASGDAPTRTGGTDSVIAIYQSFDTADLPMTLAIGNDNIWRRFWEAVGQTDMLEQPGLSSNAERRARRAEIVGVIAAILVKKPREEWLALFRANRIPAGPINSIPEVVQDEGLISRGTLYRLRGADGRVVPQVGTGILLNGEPNVARRAPPLLGEHTDEVLGGLRGSK
jgi:crotonobetainyl-CoA:carnitine CoA-transferase CaiB-like acyl-CoA transferase